jgi:hypothetical protein
MTNCDYFFLIDPFNSCPGIAADLQIFSQKHPIKLINVFFKCDNSHYPKIFSFV